MKTNFLGIFLTNCTSYLYLASSNRIIERIFSGAVTRYENLNYELYLVG
jgi:hypothetical protein